MVFLIGWDGIRGVPWTQHPVGPDRADVTLLTGVFTYFCTIGRRVRTRIRARLGGPPQMQRRKIQIEFGWADTTLVRHVEQHATDATDATHATDATDEEIDALVVRAYEAAASYRAECDPGQPVDANDLLDWLREELAWEYGEDDVGEIHERVGRLVPQPCLL